MSEHSTDPFEAAAAGVGEQWLNPEGEGAAAPTSPLNGTEPIEPPPEPKPTRLRNRSGTARRRGRPPRTEKQAREVQGEPGTAAKPAAPAPPPIKPEAIAPLIKQLDQALVKFLQTEPLTHGEVNEGAVAFAPLIDHYMPLLLESEKGKLWVAPTVWVLTAYGPRAIDKLNEATERKKALRFKPVVQEEPAPGRAGFSETDTSQDSRGSNPAPIGRGI